MIPIDGVMDSAKFDSDTSWTEFSYHVADEIGVKRDNLRLAYKVSTKPVKEAPKHLSKPDHLCTLFNEAAIALRELQKSRCFKSFSLIWMQM